MPYQTSFLIFIMNLSNEFQISIYAASIVSFSISILLCYLIFKLFGRFQAREFKQKRLSNLKITPLGGTAMAISFFISVRLLGQADSQIISISIFALAISILGIVDDFFVLNWKFKFLFQFLFVSIPVYMLEEVINIEKIFNVNFSNNLNFIFTVLWVLTLMNSINFIDNMDGFASINLIFICFALSLLSFVLNQNYLADISFILLFVISGFFIFNFPPAKIYMGDSGSLFIGFILGFISILFNWNPDDEIYIFSSFAPVFLFFTIPLLDFLTVFVYRLKNKISPTTGGTDHISHRLINKGYSAKNILLIFTIINLVIFPLLGISIYFKAVSVISFSIYLIFVFYLYIKFQKMEPLK